MSAEEVILMSPEEEIPKSYGTVTPKSPMKNIPKDSHQKVIPKESHEKVVRKTPEKSFPMESSRKVIPEDLHEKVTLKEVIPNESQEKVIPKEFPEKATTEQRPLTSAEERGRPLEDLKQGNKHLLHEAQKQQETEELKKWVEDTPTLGSLLHEGARKRRARSASPILYHSKDNTKAGKNENNVKTKDTKYTS